MQPGMIEHHALIIRYCDPAFRSCFYAHWRASSG
jgi:hypothetical protein